MEDIIAEAREKNEEIIHKEFVREARFCLDRIKNLKKQIENEETRLEKLNNKDEKVLFRNMDICSTPRATLSATGACGT